jgi:hypothetical protein
MVGFIIGLLLEGLLFGAVVRLVLPGEQDWTIGKTVGIGVVGWLVVGFVVRAIFGIVAGLVLPLLILGGLYLWFARRWGAHPRR